MILKITLCLFVLIVINFLLLKFSCTKTTKPQKRSKKPVVIKSTVTRLSTGDRLAPTGS
mgnify:CR=1 FL=1